jgi:hypothetical protein
MRKIDEQMRSFIVESRVGGKWNASHFSMVHLRCHDSEPLISAIKNVPISTLAAACGGLEFQPHDSILLIEQSSGMFRIFKVSEFLKQYHSFHLEELKDSAFELQQKIKEAEQALGLHNKSRASEKVNQALSELKTKSKSVIEKPKDFQAYIVAYIEHLRVKNSTKYGYRLALDKYVKFCASKSILPSTESGYKEYRKSLLLSQQKIGSIEPQLRPLTRLFRWAESNGIYKDITLGYPCGYVALRKARSLCVRYGEENLNVD